MDDDPVLMGVSKQDLQNLLSSQIFAYEQDVDYWKAAQDLIHPEVEVRRSAVEQLALLGAASHSPLLVYLLASRLGEPDVSLRAAIVDQLSTLLDLPLNGRQSASEALYFLKTTLSQLRHNQIVSLLDLVDANPQEYSQVSKIIGQCSHAGDHLVEVIRDRQASLATRQLAARLIGDIGYLCAISSLERIEARLESRIQSVAMSADRLNADAALLPFVQDALLKLKS